MLLSNCDTCRHVKRSGETDNEFPSNSCNRYPDYVTRFNATVPFAPPIYEATACEGFEFEAPAFEVWVEAVDQAIAAQNNGRRLCELYPPLYSRREGVFRAYFEEMAANHSVQSVAFLIIGDCLQADQR